MLWKEAVNVRRQYDITTVREHVHLKHEAVKKMFKVIDANTRSVSQMR